MSHIAETLRHISYVSQIMIQICLHVSMLMGKYPTSVFISLKGLRFAWKVTDPILVNFKQQVGYQESCHNNVHPREHVERQEQCLEGCHLSCARALEHVLIDASWCKVVCLLEPFVESNVIM